MTDRVGQQLGNYRLVRLLSRRIKAGKSRCTNDRTRIDTDDAIFASVGEDLAGD